MSQAQCTAEVEAWLVRNNFTEPQRAHLLQQVDALSDFSEAVDEDIPAITAGWSSLARSKLRRCVAKLCAERGWECKLAAAAPLGSPDAALETRRASVRSTSERLPGDGATDERRTQLRSAKNRLIMPWKLDSV